MLVYFAHPIDQAPEKIKEIYQLRGLLTDIGASCYRPGAAFTVQGTVSSRELSIVDRINTFALRACDALFAFLPEGIPTLGTPAEIEASLAADKPTLIITHDGLIDRSVQIENWRNRGAWVFSFESISKVDDASRWGAVRKALETRPSLLTGDQPEFDDPADEVSRETTLLIEAAANQLIRSYAEPLQVQLDAGARLPARGHPDDAGLDLATNEDVTIHAGGYMLIPTGVRAAVPTGWWGMITGRSSTWARYRCQVHMAVIDSGYRGELMIGVRNEGPQAVSFPAGVRLAQYVLIPSFAGPVEVTDQLPDHARGTNGYGSTGQ